MTFFNYTGDPAILGAMHDVLAHVHEATLRFLIAEKTNDAAARGQAIVDAEYLVRFAATFHSEFERPVVDALIHHLKEDMPWLAVRCEIELKRMGFSARVSEDDAFELLMALCLMDDTQEGGLVVEGIDRGASLGA